jgi:hypothetical protein
MGLQKEWIDGHWNNLLLLAFFGLEGIELQVDRHHYIKEQR